MKRFSDGECVRSGLGPLLECSTRLSSPVRYDVGPGACGIVRSDEEGEFSVDCSPIWRVRRFFMG